MDRIKIENVDGRTISIIKDIYDFGGIKNAVKNGVGAYSFLYESIPNKNMIYFINAYNNVKIGTVKNRDNLLSRMKTIKNTIPCESSMISICIGGRKEESMIHKALSKFKKHGEWFSVESLNCIDFLEVN